MQAFRIALIVAGVIGVGSVLTVGAQSPHMSISDESNKAVVLLAGQPDHTTPPTQQPPPQSSPPTPAPTPPRLDEYSNLFASYRRPSRRTRLARLPNMFGDSFLRGGTIQFSNVGPPFTNRSTVPLAGGNRGTKVGENNKAIPTNRIYCLYNHFHNAIDTSVSGGVPGGPLTVNGPVDRYTVGFESTFLDELWSVELRMPFSGSYDFSLNPAVAASRVDVHGGNVGNLSVILKRIIYEDATTAASIGMGVEVPTGNRASSRTGLTNITFENNATILHPFVAVLHSPNPRLFYHGFAQLVVPTYGNLVHIGGAPLGRVDDQTAMYLDLSAGYWLSRQPNGLITGIASIVECHYTTTLESADVLRGAPGAFAIGNLANQVDVVNATTALHLELGGDTTLRVGGVLPITTGDNRFFDAEVTIQLNRYY